MKYSLPEYSPYTNQNRTEPMTSNYYQNTVQSTERYGIPNYSTVLPSSIGNSSGYIRKPLMNPNRTVLSGNIPQSNSNDSDMETPPETTTPTTPVTPAMPTQPRTTTPATPTTPAMPRTTTPATPTTPAMPRTTTPATPTTPAMPRTTTPATPAMPRTPATPATPAMPRTPTTPATPAMPRTTTPTMPPNQPRTTVPATPIIPTQPQNSVPTTPSMPTQPQNSVPTTPSMSSDFIPTTRSQEYTTRPRTNYAPNYQYTAQNNSNNNMYMPDMNINPYHMPMGVPMMPLYGYDNCEDSDKDWDYMKQMYPLTAKKILGAIDEECDKLEYDGSCMFDEYPDKVYLGRIVDRVYTKVKYLDEDYMVSPESISPTANQYESYDNSYVQTKQYYRPDRNSRDNRDGRRDRDNRHDRNVPNRLRDLIEILLFNEILNRRRRFRGRNRWF